MPQCRVFHGISQNPLNMGLIKQNRYFIFVGLADRERSGTSKTAIRMFGVVNTRIFANSEILMSHHV
jgi:hypothetical protein